MVFARNGNGMSTGVAGEKLSVLGSLAVVALVAPPALLSQESEDMRNSSADRAS